MGQKDTGRYANLGVSAGKAEVHEAIAGQDKGLFPEAFCKILPDIAGDPAFCWAMHADGAGTKALIPWLMDQEGLKGVGAFAGWPGIAVDAAIMNLDDLGCIGALGPFYLLNTIGRNSKLISGEVLRQIIEGYSRLQDQLAKEGILLELCGGETADVGDLVRTIIADCTVAVRLRRDKVIDCCRIRPGDVIVGFSSTGEAIWEDYPNSGIGSNGLTLARHSLLSRKYCQPETFAPQLDPTLVYVGKFGLADLLPGDPRFTIGSALASPTRTYLPLIKRLLAEIPREMIHGIIHCSGGGQTKIGKFGPPWTKYVIDNPFPVPPLFQVLKEVAGQTWYEMFQVYNMGCRLEAVVPELAVDACRAAAAECQIDSRVVGRVEYWSPHPLSNHVRQVEIFVPWANQTHSYYF